LNDVIIVRWKHDDVIVMLAELERGFFEIIQEWTCECRSSVGCGGAAVAQLAPLSQDCGWRLMTSPSLPFLFNSSAKFGIEHPRHWV